MRARRGSLAACKLTRQHSLIKRLPCITWRPERPFSYAMQRGSSWMNAAMPHDHTPSSNTHSCQGAGGGRVGRACAALAACPGSPPCASLPLLRRQAGVRHASLCSSHTTTLLSQASPVWLSAPGMERPPSLSAGSRRAFLSCGTARQTAKASACIRWDSPQDRTTCVGGGGTCGRTRRRKSTTGKVMPCGVPCPPAGRVW